MAEKVNVTVLKDGPYQLSNVRTLKFDDELQSVEGDIWLCRCGRSANAPFCDGSHDGHNMETGDNTGPVVLTPAAEE